MVFLLGYMYLICLPDFIVEMREIRERGTLFMVGGKKKSLTTSKAILHVPICNLCVAAHLSFLPYNTYNIDGWGCSKVVMMVKVSTFCGNVSYFDF